MFEGWASESQYCVEILTEVGIGLVCLAVSLIGCAVIDRLLFGRRARRMSRADQIEECLRFISESESSPVDGEANGTSGCGDAIERSQAAY
ncbi:hypothetical protein [Schlesneria paludicola]|uniref:hypothetical protein n=1 Tax=Schlesneria paludicola TaxID=360056 RepID=UPI00029A5596|nr:hypothetical protein [Schlesneria paludicola]